MNEVKTVHLGRQQFVIAIDAHKALRNYLAAIEKQPGVQAEVVKEVESRMAELLTERGIAGEKVVLMEDVDFLKQQLGEPRDFKDEDEAGSEAAASTGDGHADNATDDETANPPKRLYRDTDNAWLAGVASGLAAYFGIDVILIRIAFIALTFASGFGVLLYIVLWALAPEAKTPRERLQMRGKAVTVDSLKEMVDRADIAGAGQRAGRNFGRIIGQVAEAFARVLLGVIGVGFIAAGAAVMLWSLTAGAYMLVHGGQVGADIVFPLGTREVWFTILAFVTALIVGFFLLMSGVAMVSRKWRLPVWLTAPLVVALFITAGIGTALGFDTVPHIRERFQAAHHTQVRSLDAFENVVIEGNNTSYQFQPDSRTYVELRYLGSADASTITTAINDGTLTINSQAFMDTQLCSGICFYNDRDLSVVVHAPRLGMVNVRGHDNHFDADEALNQTAMQVRVARHSDNSVHFANLAADSVELNDSRTQTDRIMNVNGIIANQAGGPVVISDENDVTQVATAATFILNTDDQCDNEQPLVYVDDRQTVIQVNGKTLSGDELRKQQSDDARNAYNCVSVQ